MRRGRSWGSPRWDQGTARRKDCTQAVLATLLKNSGDKLSAVDVYAYDDLIDKNKQKLLMGSRTGDIPAAVNDASFGLVKVWRLCRQA